jgi:hypothetical protein
MHLYISSRKSEHPLSHLLLEKIKLTSRVALARATPEEAIYTVVGPPVSESWPALLPTSVAVAAPLSVKDGGEVRFSWLRLHG